MRMAVPMERTALPVGRHRNLISKRVRRIIKPPGKMAGADKAAAANAVTDKSSLSPARRRINKPATERIKKMPVNKGKVDAVTMADAAADKINPARRQTNRLVMRA